MIKKIITTGDLAREKLLEGVLKLDDAVSTSLGPKGLNAIIEVKYSPPMITNDGVTIARYFRLEDKTSDLAAQAIINAALKTNYRVGDGTTTTVALACAIVKKCFEKLKLSSLSFDCDPITLSGEIEKSAKKALELLQKKAQPFTEGVLKNVLTTSLRDVDYAEKLTEMVLQVGKNGTITVDDNWQTQDTTTFEVSSGMKFYGTYATPYMITNARGDACIEDSSVFITNFQIESIKQIDFIFKQMQNQGKTKLVIIASSFARPAIIALAIAAQQFQKGDPNIMQILGIKTPSLTPNEYEDIATFTGGRFVNNEQFKELGDFFGTNPKIEFLGYIKKALTDKDDVVLSGGSGDITARVIILQAELENEKDEMFKEKKKRRIASLSSGIGTIRVGAPTEPERKYIKLKLEDAVCSAKAAQEEGYVCGGGLALKKIAEELGVDNILYEPLLEPYKRIQAGFLGGLEIPDTVIDPVKVLRYAILNSCSVAAKLITVYSTNADENKGLLDEFEKKLYPSDDNDFRHKSNQDMAAGKLIE
mgnify:CR=1 FL=1